MIHDFKVLEVKNGFILDHRTVNGNWVTVVFNSREAIQTAITNYFETDDIDTPTTDDIPF